MQDRSLQRSLEALAAAVGSLACALCMAGCRTPAQHRAAADAAALRNIAAAETVALGRSGPFTIARPSAALRERLLRDQRLTQAAPAPAGALPAVATNAPEAAIPPGYTPGAPCRLTLLQALHVAAQNSSRYQDEKERLFGVALDLDVAQNTFRSVGDAKAESNLAHDRTGDTPVTSLANSAGLGLARTFATGAKFTAQLTADLVKLLTGSRVSASGLSADASVSVPLLRGAGRAIAREPLTLAERNVLYAVWTFEEYRRGFVVDLCRSYLDVLGADDQVANAWENYQQLLASAQRAASLAQAGLLPEIQVDQAKQDVLRAQNGWVSARREASQRLDTFKVALGLPPDAAVLLDHDELRELVNQTTNTLGRLPNGGYAAAATNHDPRTALGLALGDATRIALDHRGEIRVAQGQLEDARRAVAVAADALRAELTLLGSAAAGGRRSGAASAGEGNAALQPKDGSYGALLKLDLPVERTAERAAYRKSLLDLDQGERALRDLEDKIKLEVANRVSSLLEQRQSIAIQAVAVELARRRQASTTLFLEAGRAQIRDVLEAQAALLSAQNSLTTAVVSHRLAELELQRNLGILAVEETGRWTETPLKELPHVTP